MRDREGEHLTEVTPTTEELVQAYSSADVETKKLVRDLVRKGTPDESRVVLEILHYFPGTHV